MDEFEGELCSLNGRGIKVHFEMQVYVLHLLPSNSRFLHNIMGFIHLKRLFCLGKHRLTSIKIVKSINVVVKQSPENNEELRPTEIAVVNMSHRRLGARKECNIVK